MKDKINWGIIGTGAIGKTFARALPASRTARLVAVASRSRENAEAFAKEFNARNAFGSYEAMLNDSAIDAVYISTPHPFHAQWTLRACRAKKHVLVEKPMALNHADSVKMIEAAKENDVFLMEAFMYRCHPQTAKLIELIREKAIGEVRAIQATLSFQRKFDPQQRLFNSALGGGGILDVGGYPVSMSRLIAGVATGKNFADPIDVKGIAHLGQTGVDEWAIASMKFPGDIVAQLSCGVSVVQESVVRIFGSEGHIFLPTPWMTGRIDAEKGRIVVQRQDNSPPREITIEPTVVSYTFEADVVGNAILSGAKQAPLPAMTWDDSLGNMRTLDRWRESIGLIYESEKAARK